METNCKSCWYCSFFDKLKCHPNSIFLKSCLKTGGPAPKMAELLRGLNMQANQDMHINWIILHFSLYLIRTRTLQRHNSQWSSQTLEPNKQNCSNRSNRWVPLSPLEKTEQQSNKSKIQWIMQLVNKFHSNSCTRFNNI